MCRVLSRHREQGPWFWAIEWTACHVVSMACLGRACFAVGVLAHDAAVGRDAGFVMVRPRAKPSVLRADGGSLDLGPRARGGRPRHATSAASLVPRPRGRGRTPPYAGRWNIRLAARALRMESPFRRTHAGIRWQQGRLTLPGTVGARRCQCPRNLLCHPHAIGGRRAFHRAAVGRTVDAIAGCGSSSLSGAAAALHDASTPAAVG